jgi:CxxC motif-containing protein (DUF1111 family)
MKAKRPFSSHLPLSLAIGVFIAVVSVPMMQGQSTAAGATDIGPRNPGTAAFTTVCPVGNPVKFPPVGGLPNCIDLDQPPSQPPQPPAAGAGNVVGFAGPLVGLWFESINVFEAVASVQGSGVVPSEPIVGLGPAFNSNSCVSCHSAPVVGGTSPGSVTITQRNGTQEVFNMPLSFDGNPELAAMEDQGNTFNQNPSFPTPFSGPGFQNVPVNGPSIEVRVLAGGGSGGFVVQPGSVAELFTIQSRTDAPNCLLSQFPFSSLGNRSIAFRIPTPTFGLGLVEATPDATLMANSPAGTVTSLGVVNGNFNRTGNDGTITRFGWKAQNKSLLIFAGEASNVEMGVTNELFPNEKNIAANGPSTQSCPANISPAGNQPEDEILPATFPAGTGASNIASIISANTENNAVFMRLNAPPSQCDAVTLLTSDPYGTTGPAQCPAFTTAPVLNGQTLFNNAKVGCAQCHSPTLVSGLSQNASLSNQTYHPYSDFALHNMGQNLSDGVTQGGAGPAFFRTAPLWGVGQRIFFLHDGRASDLVTAIEQHCPTPATTGGGEACGSINAFNNLTQAQQQAILDFLRSL